MNNNTKSANIMTWSTYKKKFNPTLYSTTDSLGGKMIVDPTMKKSGFQHIQIMDLSVFYSDEKKPLDIVKEQIDVFKWTYIIYYCWTHRDNHGKGIDIYYI